MLLEKKGLTTFLLIDLMINAFGLNRNMIGIAGLKDKHAITRQWISISRRDVVKYCGGINTLLDWLRRKGKIIKATYHTHLLKLGDNAGNHFDITLIPEKGITPEQKQTVDYCLKEIAAKGIPNYFGEQRFGFG
ncbi:MAG: tRNA pseudouridine(13) synthase TruD [bacterium]